MDGVDVDSVAVVDEDEGEVFIGVFELSLLVLSSNAAMSCLNSSSSRVNAVLGCDDAEEDCGASRDEDGVCGCCLGVGDEASSFLGEELHHQPIV